MADFATTFAEVKDVCQPDLDPVLTYGDGVTPNPAKDIDRLILKARRARVWAANTVFRVGERIIPTVPNGLEYRVKRSGNSGTVEPVWSSGYLAYGAGFGTAIQYEEVGLDGGEFDEVEACKQACLLKSRRCSDRQDYQADGVNYKETAQRDYWRKESERFEAVIIA